MAAYAEKYRGHDKHKARPTQGVKGTFCPEWTHLADGQGVGNDMFAHDWSLTRAQELLDSSVTEIATRRRYATGGGVAFEVRPTNDGTFHGFPLPWDKVPTWLRSYWRQRRLVSKRQIREYSEINDNDRWAMDTIDAG